MSELKVALHSGAYILAVSGGVDSMVLLDILARQRSKDTRFWVAHIDHGVRSTSHKDAVFVAAAAKKYSLPFLTRRFELGENASEELARRVRYAFLQSVAREHQAQIVTAHHADDVLETMAINWLRGTGWRGMAALRSETVLRPLLGYWKEDILAYAQEKAIAWHEDSTNKDSKYLRNRLRKKLANANASKKRQLLELHERQVALKVVIEAEASRVLTSAWVKEREYTRYLFIMIEETVAIELLRTALHNEFSFTPTRPQLTRILHAIKTFRSGAIYSIDSHSRLTFTRTTFIVHRAQAW